MWICEMHTCARAHNYFEHDQFLLSPQPTRLHAHVIGLEDIFLTPDISFTATEVKRGDCFTCGIDKRTKLKKNQKGTCELLTGNISFLAEIPM